MKKGISPLLTAVIVIAIVIGVAILVSHLFLGFMKSRKSEIKEMGGEATNCYFANFKIVPESVGGWTVDIHLIGKTTLSKWTYTVYNTTGEVRSGMKNHQAKPGDIFTLNISDAKVADPYRIVMSTQECPGIKSIVEESESGEWKLMEKGVECLTDEDCTNPDYPYCVDYTCAQCRTAQDCTTQDCPDVDCWDCVDGECVEDPIGCCPVL